MIPRPSLVVIDDEAEFTKTISQFFTDRGYVVRVAATGGSGLSLVEEERPDVVLVDLKLPGMDGDEILSKIKEIDSTIPVIVITAYNDGGKTKERLMSMGAFAFFDKPISSLRDLHKNVSRAIF